MNLSLQNISCLRGDDGFNKLDGRRQKLNLDTLFSYLSCAENQLVEVVRINSSEHCPEELWLDTLGVNTNIVPRQVLNSPIKL